MSRRPCRGRRSSRLGSGLSATRHSVVSISAAMLAAFCRAERVTLVGSTTRRDQVHVLVGGAFKPTAPVSFLTRSMATAPRCRHCGDLAQRGLDAAGDDLSAIFSSPSSFSSKTTFWARSNATPPRGRSPPPPQRGWRAGRPRRGPSSPSSRSRWRPHVQHRNAAGQLGQALLQLLAVVVVLVSSICLGWP